SIPGGLPRNSGTDKETCRSDRDLLDREEEGQSYSVLFTLLKTGCARSSPISPGGREEIRTRKRGDVSQEGTQRKLGESRHALSGQLPVATLTKPSATAGANCGKSSHDQGRLASHSLAHSREGFRTGGLSQRPDAPCAKCATRTGRESHVPASGFCS